MVRTDARKPVGAEISVAKKRGCVSQIDFSTAGWRMRNIW
jgi:hypothetical protein